MKRPALETVEKKKNQTTELILLVDKEGIIGSYIIQSIQDQTQDLNVIFVTQKEPSVKENTQRVLLVPYPKKVPRIPDSNYSYMIVIYNGEKEIADLLPSFFEKARESKAKFIFVLSIEENNLDVKGRILDEYRESSIVYRGEVFGEGVSLGNGNTLSKFIYYAKKERVITISDIGLEHIYPVFIDDAISKILEVTFGESKDRIFFLFPKYPPTKIGVARILQKIDPLLKVNFNGKEKKEKEVVLPKEGTYLLKEPYPLAEKITQVFQKQTMEFSTEQIRQVRENHNNQKIGGRLFFNIIFFLLSFLILPIATTGFFSFLAFQNLKTAQSLLKENNIDKVKTSASQAATFFNMALGTSRVVVLQASLIGQKEKVEHFSTAIAQGKEGSLALASILVGSQQFINVLSGTSKNPEEDFLSSSNSLKQAIITAQKIPFNASTKFLAATIDILPDIFGFKRKKTYLVLFQNNLELRPGGGFIGSYGILTLYKGKVSDFSIHDVYDADGQLKGHVEPPFAIRRYLPSVNWYLRDSNWDVDFVKSASVSAVFLNLETGKAVDGVIALDVSFIKNILDVIGPVYVSSYNQTVDLDNFYTITQSLAQKDFFPGSMQKKNFLHALYIAMKDKISNVKNISYTKLAEKIPQAIVQKHLLFAFGNVALQNVFTATGMSSSLWDTREDSGTSINDFLGINEANLGVNKVNYFVKRKISHNVTIDDGNKVLEKLVITYNNTSEKADPFGGGYKNYLRLILPLGSKLSEVTIDGEIQTVVPAVTNPLVYEKKNFLPPKDLEVEEVIEQQKTIFGFLMMVPASSLKTVVVEYTLPQNISSGTNLINYDLRLLKQPGMDEAQYDFSLTYPSTFKLIKAIGNLKPEENGVSLATSFSEDISLHTDLAKK